MPISFWCILIAALMPYPLANLARGKSVSNNNPRDQYAQQSDRQRRALAAHQNSFEVFPFFAIAILAATIGGAGSWLLDTLAVAWLVLRAAYAWLYLNDKATLRSVVFLASLVVTIVIFTLPVWW